jgi:hypothetical protein
VEEEVVVGPCQEEASYLWEDERYEDMRMHEYKLCASKIDQHFTPIGEQKQHQNSSGELLNWIRDLESLLNT